MKATILARGKAEEADFRVLGPEGWTSERKRAMRFTTPEEARDWLAEGRRTQPQLMKGARLVQLDMPVVPEADGAVIAPDYDPHEER